MARSAVPFTDMTPGNKDNEMESNVIIPSSTSTQWMDLIEIRDVNYLAMKRHFFMTGKGRRPNLPSVLLTHQLLAQLSLLRDESLSTWEDVLSLFLVLFPKQNVTSSQLQWKIEDTCKKLHLLSNSKSKEELQDFLKVQFDFNDISQELKTLGLTLPILLGDESKFSPPQDYIPSKSVLLELGALQTKRQLTDSFVVRWMQQLLKPSMSVTKSKILNALKKAKKDRQEIKKTNPDQLDTYLHEPVFQDCRNIENSNTLIQKQESTEDDIRSYRAKLHSEQRRVTKCQEMLQNVLREKDILELGKNILKKERDSLRIEKDKIREERDQMERDLAKYRILKKSRAVQCDIGESLAASEAMKNELQRTSQLVTSLLKDLEEKERKAKQQEELITKLKKQIKSEQNMKSNYKNQLRDAIETAEAILEEEGREINFLKLKDKKNNTYSESVRLTYMELQGEANVAASKCSVVVQIVAKHLFGTELSLQKDLPCKQSALNMSSEGYFLSKVQTVEGIKQSEHFTLATDATSREKRHYLERHIVLSNGGMMSLGFQEVASETAETLLETSISLINELCEIYCSSNEIALRDSLFKEILSKLKCLMSDRASVNKAFDKKMADYKREVLGTDCSTHFIFCNAHFLLGVALGADEVLKQITKEFTDQGVKLGRDAFEQFCRFSQSSSETPALRLIRAAAEIFGPRGDEKHGCRNEWLVYLESVGVTSRFTSYRNNRFNNIFDNASALVFHEKHIVDFLANKVSHDNLKLQSVAKDIEDENIMAMVSALGRFNFVFTSPYWALLNSNKSYGEFPPYVKAMEKFLEMESVGQTPVFPEFATSALFLPSNESETFCKVIAQLSKTTAEVLQRQLADFIGDGCFAGELDDEVKHVLQTAPLSNLTGERLFGDLDYDITKRRNASLHLRSTLNMWKHNRTGKWLCSKKKQEAVCLLTHARRNGLNLKRRSRAHEREVKTLILERLRENERKKQEKELKERGRHLDIVNAVLGQGGICVSKQDVDQLMLGEGNRVERLKAQLRYRKVVMQEKHLSLSGGLHQLYKTLLSSLGCECDADEPALKKQKK